MTVALVIVLLLAVGAVAWYALRRPAAEPVAVRPAPAEASQGTIAPAEPAGVPAAFDGAAPEAAVADAGVAEAAAVRAETTAAPEAAPSPSWVQRFDPRSAQLDDTGRLRLIGDLGIVAAAWCVPLLAAAYREEIKPSHRRAALTSLAECPGDDAIETFELAARSPDDTERAIAADALAERKRDPAPH